MQKAGPGLNHDDFESLRNRGLLALREGRHKEALDLLEKAVALDPSQSSIFHHLASVCQALGRREDATRYLHQVVCLKPESGDAHNNWGIGLIRLGKHAEAIAAFSQAVRLKPEFPEAFNNWGNALAEQGLPEQAIDHFRKALSLHPAYPEGRNNLGLTLARLKRFDEAIAELKEALRLNPGYAEAAGNLGNLYRDLGRLEEAVACFRDAARLRPGHPEPRFQLALTLIRLDQLEEAIVCLHQCLLFQPDAPDVYHHLGMSLARRERFEEAAAAFRQAVRLKPDSPDYHNNLGNTLLRQHKTEEAIACFLKAVEVRPGYPLAHCNLGSAFLEQGKVEESIPHYLEAIRLRPDYVDAHFNLGNAQRKLNRPQEALGSYRRVLELQPDHLGARLNTGVAYSEEGKLDEAVQVYDEIIQRKPDFGEAYNCKGIARLHQRRSAEALAEFDHGTRLRGDDAEIHLNRALCLLLRGDYATGWQEYEWRWKLKRAAPRSHPQPGWDGAPLPNGAVLLWGEQGMGDILQFVRYAPLVKERVGKVLLDCPGPLRGLLSSCPGIDALVGGDGPTPYAEAQAPLMSLPRIFGTKVNTIPASIPYLFVDAPLREQWRRKAVTGQGLKVGIAWQGNPLYSGDRYRSINLSEFRLLAQAPRVQLFSLQKGKGAEQLLPLAQEMRIIDWGKEITGDYRDTAAAILSLDLIISVDTSVAHLAGALGVPVWVLLPFNNDWRWLEERDDSPWYPSVRLFRQESWGDWVGVFRRVAQALAEQTYRPVPRRVALPMSLADLVERFAAAELRPGGGDEAREALREAGLLDHTELARHTARLQAALAGIEEIKQRMRALAPAEDLDLHAGDMVRRFARAQQERDEALAELSHWLDGEATSAAT
jgi:tetratricopeptide (TPR) repeat protein